MGFEELFVPSGLSRFEIRQQFAAMRGPFFGVGAGLSVFGTLAAGEFLTIPDEFRKIRDVAPRGWQQKNFELVLGDSGSSVLTLDRRAVRCRAAGSPLLVARVANVVERAPRRLFTASESIWSEVPRPA